MNREHAVHGIVGQRNGREVAGEQFGMLAMPGEVMPRIEQARERQVESKHVRLRAHRLQDWKQAGGFTGSGIEDAGHAKLIEDRRKFATNLLPVVADRWVVESPNVTPGLGIIRIKNRE